MTAQSTITAVKDSVGIVRELAIIAAIVLVVLDPGLLVKWAKSANEEGKRAGAKTTEVSLGLAKFAFDNSTEQAAKLEAALKANEALKKNAEQLISTARTPQTVASAKEVLHTADSLSVSLQAGISSAKTAALAQDQIIQDAPAKSTGPGAYGIVVSADKQNDAADYEVQQLKLRGFLDVAFYERQGFLRTVARFPDKSAADDALPEIQKYRRTAYMINLGKWCSDPEDSGRRVSETTIFTCQ
jgi:hypothetical protein